MTRWSVLLMAVLGLLLPGCPDDSGNEAGAPPPGPSGSDKGPIDWPSALTALQGTAMDPTPCTACTTGPEVYEGETALTLTDPNTTPNAESADGAIFTTRPTAPSKVYVEKWVVFDTNALQLLPPAAPNLAMNLDLRPVPSAPPDNGQLTPGRMNALCTLDATDPRTFQIAMENVQYFPFPGDPAIAGLPNGTPPGTTAELTYEVNTKTLSGVTQTGALYREIRTNTAGVVEWSDFWVLFDTYVFPQPGFITQVKPATTGFTTLKAFLQAMKARTPNAGWRYVPVAPISWTPLCPPPPAAPTNP